MTNQSAIAKQKNNSDLQVKINELEKLVETISKGKYMWESTFDAIASPVMIVSEDYQIQRANKAAAFDAHVNVREMIGKKCYEVLAGFDQPCENCPLKNSLENLDSNQSLLDTFPQNQKRYEVSSYPVKNVEGKWEVVLSYRDVTEEKALQGQLLRSEKMAAIGKLAGGVAHEINNPLGGILAFTQLVMRDLPEDHISQNDLKQIEEATLRCKGIVQNLLDFSRQQETDVFSPTSLNEVVKKVIPFVSVQIKKDPLDVVTDLADDLPMIHGSFQKLEQVMLNLIANAAQAMKGVDGLLRINSFADKKNKKVILEISDNGCGITPENLDRIFDPYFTTKDQGEGTGLGLAISYGIIEEHQGEIKVSSELGIGTKFTLKFPIN